MANTTTTGNRDAERRLMIQSLIRTVGMLPVLILLCIAFYFMSEGGRFGSWQNIAIVSQQAAINTVLAAGMTFVILTGGIDLSVGSMLATAAMTAMICSLNPSFGAFGLLVGLLTGAILGGINGLLIAYLRLPPFIVTLGS